MPGNKPSPEELTRSMLEESTERYCARGCGTKLSMYNKGPHCRACEAADRDEEMGLVTAGVKAESEDHGRAAVARGLLLQGSRRSNHDGGAS